MHDRRAGARSMRHPKARKHAPFRFASFNAGILVTLIIGAILLINGHGDAASSTQPAIALSAAFATSPAAAQDLDGLSSFSVAPSVTPSAVIPGGVPYSVTLYVENEVEMIVGETRTLKATLDPSDPTASLSWKSSDEKIVKVNEEGEITAVGAGTALVELWVDNDDGAKAVVSIKVEKESGDVWIPRTGKKYHSNPKCSNMQDPRKVSLSEARSMGYTACKKCYWLHQ